eukprot:TRINITY_DN1917_c0_g1_i1.p1 TRINITY_DN1917_c0_g1~~TRINITY_DN1917_c0_g1_i1.p1  ORF type:complete len:813 (-),score=185.05 TRINITY_DN1917_c0_g1_i1:47-2485(-)
MGQGSSTQFPYDVGKVVSSFDGHPIWRLHEGTKLENGASVSVFAFDLKNGTESAARAARNALKRMKTIRFPSILRYLDGVELESTIYIVTDSVVPLAEVLPSIRDKPEVLIWGLYQVIRAMSFLNIDCNLIHGNISPKSIFVNKAGDWLLGGLDLVCDGSNTEIIQVNWDVLSDAYKSPEYYKRSWSSLTDASWAADSWSLGCLIYEIFNGVLTKSAELKSVGQIPPKLVSLYQQLLNQQPKARLPCNKVLESDFFKSQLVEVNLFLENLALKDSQEKETFFKKLPTFLESMSEPMLKYKIMPILVQALQYGTGVNTRVLASLLKIGEHLSEEEYQANIVPCVTKLFSCNDRAIRIHLLQSLDSYCEHLPVALINEQIFPQMINGFTDTSAALRDLTIKSMILIVPKLREKEVNTQVLKYFAQLQMDSEPGIRTNTTICLGKIAKSLSVPTQQKVLIPAFMRALKDPFNQARNASLLAVSATLDLYTPEDTAQRILPSIAPLTLDPDGMVRNTCFQTIQLLMARLEAHSKKLEQIQKQQEAAAAQQTSPNVPSTSNPESKTLQGVTKATYAGAEALTWAFSSIKSKIYDANASQGTIGAAQELEGNQGLTTEPKARSVSEPPQKPTQSATADGWDADGWGDDDSVVNSSQSKAAPSTSKDGWDDDEGDVWDSLTNQTLQKSQSQPSYPPPGAAMNVHSRLPSAGMRLGVQSPQTSQLSIPTQPPKKEPILSKPVSDGWDDADGFGDDGWEPAKPVTSAPRTSSQSASSDSGLTKLELQQKRKEERLSRTQTSKSGSTKPSLGAVRKIQSHDD